MKRLSDEKILADLREAARRLGKTPTRGEYKNIPGLADASVLETRFGSWNAALERVGLEPNLRRYTDAQLIESLRRAADELGGTPAKYDLRGMKGFPDPEVYSKRFGSWAEAVRRAGLPPRVVDRRHYTDRYLLEALARAADDLGRTPTWGEFRAMEGVPGMDAYRDRFGSWREALRLAGLTPRSRGGISDDELAAELRRAAAVLGNTPSKEELRLMDGFPNPDTYWKRYGSWGEAVRRAGLPPRVEQRKKYTDEFMLCCLREAAEALGIPPSIEEFEGMEGYPHPDLYKLRFGSWEEARRKAGLPERPPTKRIGTDELLQLLRQAAEVLGGPPLRRELDALEGYPCSDTYMSRFGTWPNALLAAGLIERKHGPTLIGRLEQRVIVALDGGVKSAEQIARDENMTPTPTRQTIDRLVNRGLVEEVERRRGGAHSSSSTVDERLNEVLEREHRVFEVAEGDEDRDRDAGRDHLALLLEWRRRRETRRGGSRDRRELHEE